MIQARGCYRSRGTRSAAHTIARQVDGIAAAFPEIKDYHLNGTINVRFEPKIIVAGGDHRTSPIRWDGGERGEVFDLVRVRLVIEELAVQLRALMYVAHWSLHRNDPHQHEFLAERFVVGLREGMSVLMCCDRNSTELPYEASEKGGNGRPRLARTIVIL